MWREVMIALKKLVLLQKQTDDNTADIKELRQELKDLSLVVKNLSFEMRTNRADEAHEREKMALRLENILLKFERRLPPPSEN